MFSKFVHFSGNALASVSAFSRIFARR